MPDYEFLYTVSEGDFQMDVATGIRLFADDDSHALKVASDVDKILSAQSSFRVFFNPFPEPDIVIQSSGPAYVARFQILRPVSASQTMWGLPIFTDADFEVVGKNVFLHRMLLQYGRKRESFEAISYFVRYVAAVRNERCSRI